MPTVRQRKAFKNLVENGGIVSTAMIDAGLSPRTARTPQKLTESKGFLQLCEEAGLTDEFLTTALYDDIRAKKRNRKPELELAFKVKGRLKDKEGDKTTNVFMQITGMQIIKENGDTIQN